MSRARAGGSKSLISGQLVCPKPTLGRFDQGLRLCEGALAAQTRNSG
jgi:hypothetical protein